MFLSINSNPEKIKGYLRSILSRREFSGLKPGWLEQLLSELSRLEFIKTILNHIAYAIKIILQFLMSESVISFSYVIVAIIFGILLAYIIIRIKNRISSFEKADVVKDSPQHIKDSLTLEKLAKKYEKDKNYPLAMHYLYLSFLYYLNLQDIMINSETKTNKEAELFLEEVGSRELNNSFKKLNAIFEHKIYAMEDCSEEEYKEFSGYFMNCKKEVAKIGI